MNTIVLSLILIIFSIVTNEYVFVKKWVGLDFLFGNSNELIEESIEEGIEEGIEEATEEFQNNVEISNNSLPPVNTNVPIKGLPRLYGSKDFYGGQIITESNISCTLSNQFNIENNDPLKCELLEFMNNNSVYSRDVVELKPQHKLDSPAILHNKDNYNKGVSDATFLTPTTTQPTNTTQYGHNFSITREESQPNTWNTRLQNNDIFKREQWMFNNELNNQSPQDNYSAYNTQTVYASI